VLTHRFQRVVVLKEQHNKKAHEGCAQIACEAAGAIRTVASLTREDDCLALYSKSLEGPLRESNRTSFWSNLLFSLSQSFAFFVIALTFWYGSRLVSYQEFTSKDFFVGLMVSSNGHQSGRALTIVF
jgi:ATP-binding cassette, subfamily B (MDR/TAP), member 1